MAVCDITRFPRTKYFQQHELPEYGPEKSEDFDYAFTRLLAIRVDATVEHSGTDSEVKTLSTIMIELEDGGRPGIDKNDAPWDTIMRAYVRPWDSLGASGKKVVSKYGLPRTPFDFTLWNKSRIIILLYGEFWRFSSTLAAVTTKHQYDSQYFDLQRHFILENGDVKSAPEAEWEHRWQQYDCRCVSFFCQEPCLESFGMIHGFSLNIDLLMEIKQFSGVVTPTTLPITIDPDVENKGGNPGP